AGKSILPDHRPRGISAGNGAAAVRRARRRGRPGHRLVAALPRLAQSLSAGGAVAMVLAGCLTPSQAHRSIDSRIFVFIAGAIPLGAPMEKSGTSKLLAEWLHTAVGDWSPWLALLTIYGVVAFDGVHVRRRHHGAARPGGGRARQRARTAARAVRGHRRP